MTAVDLREPPYDRVLAEGARRLGLVLVDGVARYGWGGKSAGAATTAGTWLRVVFREAGRMNERTWSGEESASVLVGVRMPSLLRSYRWLQDGLVWRVDELELVADEPLFETQQATAELELPPVWWDELAASLDALAEAKTSRVCVRQDLVTRRVDEYSDGRVDPTVTEWVTAHGDLHWANLVGPSLMILDWEGWGIGPAGLDAATLWAVSAAVPDLAEEVQSRFASVLTARDGQLSQLFMAVEFLRMNELYGDHPALAAPLRRAADELVEKLAGWPPGG